MNKGVLFYSLIREIPPRAFLHDLPQYKEIFIRLTGHFTFPISVV